MFKSSLLVAISWLCGGVSDELNIALRVVGDACVATWDILKIACVLHEKYVGHVGVRVPFVPLKVTGAV